VHTAVVWALDQIGARDRPDLWCLALSENEPNQDILNGDPAGVFALFNVNVIRSSFFEMSDTVLTEEEIEKLARGTVPDMHSRVRSFLVGDRKFMQLTNGELIKEGLVKVRSARLSDNVQGNEISWPMYEFRMLQNKDMSEWLKEHLPITMPPLLGEYLSTHPGPCGPDKKMLKSPEYSLNGSALQKCQDLQKDLLHTLPHTVLDSSCRLTAGKSSSPAGLFPQVHAYEHTYRGYASFSDICGAWFAFGSGFGIGFTLTLLLAHSPLLLTSFHTLSLSPTFTSVWWSA
jgi:hypothetical protein